MGMFRKKPVVIEAVQVPLNSKTDENMVAWGKLAAWLQMNWCVFHVVDVAPSGQGVDVMTLEGTMLARPGDWIIRGVKGEFYPCKPEIFAETYEAA